MPNGFEIIGQGLRQTAGDLGAFGERQRAYQEMVERRRAALQEQARLDAEAERQKQKTEADQARVAVEQQEKDRQAEAIKGFQDYALGEKKIKQQAQSKPYAAPGMGPSGEQTMETPAEYEMVPRSRDDLQQKALQMGVYGDPGVKAYMADTKPEKPTQARYSIQEIGNRKVRVNIDTGEQEDLGAASTNSQRDRYSIQDIGGRKIRLNMDTGEQMDVGPSTPKTNVKSEAQVRFDALPPEKQKQIELLGTALGKRQNTINELESSLKEFLDAKSDQDKERIGGGMLKTLNSPENPDAIGAEEEKRIGNALIFQKMNIFGQGQVMGRDFEGFERQVRAKLASIKASREKNQTNIDSLYGPSTPPSDPPAPAKPSTAQDKQAIAWARANATDPRAAKILNRFGLK